MDVLNRIGQIGIVPVVVLEDKLQAVDTANALVAGGVPVMEITFRTKAAAESIAMVAENCRDMLVGAGTVVELEQCKQAVRAGAKFIVSPGYNEEVVSWCVEHDIPVVPGCATPSEIMMAMRHGLAVLKFFPANVYGGLKGLKSLVGPFGGIRFIPTGGINNQNIGEYASAPFVHAVGGSWLCAKSDIAAGNFDKITSDCIEARKCLLNYQVEHVGIAADSAEESGRLSLELQNMFGFAPQSGDGSHFAGDKIEIMNARQKNGIAHIAISTNSITCALADLEAKGFAVDDSSVKYKSGHLNVIYLKHTIGGFAIHLIQKNA